MIRDVWQQALAQHGPIRVALAVLSTPLIVAGVWAFTVAYVVVLS